LKIIAHGKNCNCNELIDTIEVNIFNKEVFEIGNDTSLCLYETVERNIDPSVFVNPIWNLNFSDPYNIIVSEEGEYKVSVVDFNNCAYSDSFKITDVTIPPQIDLAKEVFICGSYIVSLPEHGYTYVWDDGDTSTYKSITKGGVYILNTSNVCGVDNDTIVVHDKNGLFTSNLITLNGDNKNDHLVVAGLPINSYGYIEIYNRWGDKIYESSQYKNEWPSMDISDGVYYYYFQYDSCVKLKGWVEIIR
jgi:hypothetical protein